MRKYLVTITLIIGLISHNMNAQVVWEHTSSKRIYEFLEELAAEQIIVINSDIKPYSRQFIASQLLVADKSRNLLNKRQEKELDVFLNEYAIETKRSLPKVYNVIKMSEKLTNSLQPIGLFYRDSLFRLSLTPIYGREYFIGENEYAFHHRGGLAFQSYISDNFGFYANVRDNYLKNYVFAKPSYLTNYEGGNYKLNEGGRTGGDYSEMRGGLTWSWKWGNLGLVKECVEWGQNVNGSNIFNSSFPSMTMLKLNMHPTEWFDFNYFHGSPISMVIDSARSYVTTNGDFRSVFRRKYIAANMFTFRPWKQFSLSLGNSIIYSDMDIQPAYLIPFMFYKSLDHTINKGIDNQNSQMFVSISSKNIKHLNLYATYFIDEFSITRIFNPTRRNFTSFKGGICVSNLGIQNVMLFAEYTQTNPLTYKHRVPTLTYTTNDFSMGHYLGDNARDLYLALKYKPTAALSVKLSCGLAQKGNDYAYLRIPGQRVDEFPYLKDIIWQKKYMTLETEYFLSSNLRFNIGWTVSNVETHDADGKTAAYYMNKFTSPFFQGWQRYLNVGLILGM